MSTFNVAVAASGDDVSISASASMFWDNVSDCAVGFPFDSSDRSSAFRFDGITIENAATINSASITYVARDSRSNTTVNARMILEDADDPAAITSKANFDGRTRTTAYTDWSNMAAQTAGTSYTSPDIATAVKEVVDRAGWASGQAMIVFMQDNGSDATPLDGRVAASHDHATYDPPELDIDYTVATTTRRYSLTILSVG